MQSDPLAPPELQIVLDALRRIVRALGASSRTAQTKLGVTGAQLFVLTSLRGTRAISMGELARRTGTHQSTVSGVTQHLKDAGLVIATPSEIDRRRLNLRLTPAGRALLRKAPGAAQEGLIAGFKRLPKETRRRLARDLPALVAAMRLSKEPPLMFFEEPKPRAGSRRERP
jgi:DNA-binding MarR family transcriptional regulator